MFEAFEEEFLKAKQILPFRTEISLFHCGLGIAGQADLIGVARCGGLVIIDWKRSKAIREDNWFTCMRSPIAHLPDCNLVHYQLQLNVYRYILQTEYQMCVVTMFLCIRHPAQASHRVIEVVPMDEELDALVSHARSSYGCQAPLPGAWAPFTIFPKLAELRGH